MEISFPLGFIWGAATAALQIEGATRADGRGDSVWDVFCREHPERIFERATPELACDHYHRWAEDVRLMRHIGLNGYRFSIAWPRLFPEGDGRLNESGAGFYDRLIDALLEAGIEPNVTLFHWDLPQPLAVAGNWENPRTAEAFLAYAETCFKRYGDRVKRWATFNEPGWMTLNGWVTGLHPPCKKEFAAAVRVATTLIVTHSRVVERYRDLGQNGQIGLVLNMSAVYPASSDPADVEAASLADALLNRWFSDPVLLGTFPEEAVELYERSGFMPVLSPADERLLENTRPDFIGVNYYYPHHASADATETSFHINNSGRKEDDCLFSIAGLFRFVRNPHGRYTDWGWEIYPEGLYHLLERVHRYRPGMPIYVTENGIGLPDRLVDGTVDDQPRIDYLRDHLREVHRAIQAGINVRGYYPWSLMDNFSWINGYKKRYGFLYIDRETMTRTMKKSAFWYRDVARGNGW